jgi:hypothetical protein
MVLEQKKILESWKNNSLTIFRFISIFIFSFICTKLLHRKPLFEKMEIKKEYTDTDLLFTKKMIVKQMQSTTTYKIR